jgi:hypothetical protein
MASQTVSCPCRYAIPNIVANGSSKGAAAAHSKGQQWLTQQAAYGQSPSTDGAQPDGHPSQLSQLPAVKGNSLQHRINTRTDPVVTEFRQGANVASEVIAVRQQFSSRLLAGPRCQFTRPRTAEPDREHALAPTSKEIVHRESEEGFPSQE